MAKTKSAMVRIYNSSNQMIPISVRPKGSDFWTNEQQIRLMPGTDVLLPKTHLRWEQIDNLQKKRKLRVIYDSSKEN